MKKLFSTMLIAFVCAGALLAQERVQKVITIKNGNLTGILKTVRELAPASNMAISTDNLDHIILSGSKETVSGFEEMIKQLDVPAAVKRDIESTVYMIVASTQIEASNPLPAELDPVSKQLKGIFNYKSFRLLESFVLRSRDGESGSTSGTLLAEKSPGDPIRYDFQYRRVSLDGSDNARSVRFERVHFSLRVPVGSPNPVHYENAGIETDVDVPEGKKVVVGKTSGMLGSDSALILVISAKVVD